MSNQHKNLFLIIGTVIGAGIFSLPFALKSAGTIPFLLLVVLIGYLLVKVNFFYREIVESTEERHQLAGYARNILGLRASQIAVFLLLFSTYGACLAYLILGGDFLAGIVPIRPLMGSLIFFVVAAAVLLFSGRTIEAWDVVFTIIKSVLLIFIIGLSVGHLLYNKIDLTVPFVGSNPFLGYGTILFALSGFSIVPELKKDEKLRLTMYSAQFLIIVLYILFAFANAPLLAGSVISFPFTIQKILLNITGVFAVLTPYLMLSWVGYDLLNKDMGLDRRSSLVVTTLLPLLLFLLGLQNFSKIIGLTGGVFLGGIAILIAIMYEKLRPGRDTLLVKIIQGVFFMGMVAEIVVFFS